MAEVYPRPHKPNLFVQVSVAVISGAAAMYCIQSFHPAADSPAPAAHKSSPAAGTNEPRPPRSAGSDVTPVPAVVDPDADSSRFKSAPPAAVSMLIAPEPGGAPGGVVSFGDDGPVPGAAVPSPLKKQEAAAAPAGKETPLVHLQPSNLHSRYTGDLGHDFQSPQLTPRLFPKKQALKAEPAPEAPKPAPQFLTSPRNFDDKGIPQKDIFVPSLLHPEIVPEKPFWDYERKRRAAVAGLIALSGLLYLMSMMGFFNAFVAKPRFDDEPGP